MEFLETIDTLFLFHDAVRRSTWLELLITGEINERTVGILD